MDNCINAAAHEHVRNSATHELCVLMGCSNHPHSLRQRQQSQVMPTHCRDRARRAGRGRVFFLSPRLQRLSTGPAPYATNMLPLRGSAFPSGRGSPTAPAWQSRSAMLNVTRQAPSGCRRAAAAVGAGTADMRTLSDFAAAGAPFGSELVHACRAVRLAAMLCKVWTAGNACVTANGMHAAMLCMQTPCEGG
eukprot:365668-Chlamydomonas_euryale.AAC.3